MKIEDAITLADLTIGFMKASNIGTDKPLDNGTLQLIEVMETLVEYSKKYRLKEMVASIKNDEVLKQIKGRFCR